MQPAVANGTAAPMVPLQVKEILHPGPRGRNSIETVGVPLLAEQLRTIGRQIGPLKKETDISWLTELALLGESSGYTVVDLVDIMHDCLDMKGFAALQLDIENQKVQNTDIVQDEILKLFSPSEPVVVLSIRNVK